MRNSNKIGLFLFILMTVFALYGALSSAVAAESDYDIAGRWKMEGQGFGEKSPVRLTLALDGYLDIHTDTLSGRRCITGYDLWLRITTSRLDIKTWSERCSETLSVPIPLPELRPTLSEPFALPAVRTKEGLIYRPTLKGVSSGTVDIYGTIDLDVVGATEINSAAKIWKEGTEKPETKDLRSGCGVGQGSVLLLFPLLIAFGWRRRS